MNLAIRQITGKRFIRFLIIGGVNTAFGYIVFFLLTVVGLHYALAAFFSTSAGVVFNFFTISRVVFRKKENRLLGRFCLVYGIVYLLNILLIRAIEHSGLAVTVIQAILLLPLAIVSYTLNRLIVFRENES